jgi:4-hydroxyphenylacetate 3-monooxygenase
MPVSAPGLRLYPRRPYATLATSAYDYPLSARYDEVDTTVVLDDVLVPWEHVFIHGDVERVAAQFSESPAHVTANFQALVRFGVKLEFMAGLVAKLVEMQGSAVDPAVQATVGGEIATYCAMFDSLVQAAERNPIVSSSYARPHPQYVYAGMSLQRRLIGEMYRTIRELAGGAFQNLPSSEASFIGATTRADTERHYAGLTTTARDRVKLLRLIWDLIGTEFGGRQLQYEMFYSAAQPVVNRRMYRSYDWTAAKGLVDRLLSEY